MQVFNYPTKIIGSALVFCVAVGLVFGYGISWLSHKHEEQLTQILEEKKSVLELRQEQRNIELAQQDLRDLALKNHQPEDFFSKDTALVSDLSMLEAQARNLHIDFTLNVSGTLNTAVKAKTSSELYIVPFSVQLSGSFNDILAYLDFLEHAPTVFTARSVTVTAAAKGLVSVSLVGNFYLRK